MRANLLGVFLVIFRIAVSLFSIILFVNGYYDGDTHEMLFWGLMLLITQKAFITVEFEE